MDQQKPTPDCTCPDRFVRSHLFQITVLDSAPHHPDCPAATQPKVEQAVPSWNPDALTVPVIPSNTPPAIKESHEKLKIDPHNWEEVVRLAALHEKLNWEPQQVEYIRLRRVRNALAIVLRIMARENHRAAAEWFYKHRIWEQKKQTIKIWKSKKQKENDVPTGPLYNLHAQWTTMAVRYDHAAYSMYYDHAQYWPSLINGSFLPVELISEFDRLRLTEPGDVFDLELRHAAKELVVKPWVLHYELPSTMDFPVGEFVEDRIESEIKDYVEKYHPGNHAPPVKATFTLKKNPLEEKTIEGGDCVLE